VEGNVARLPEIGKAELRRKAAKRQAGMQERRAQLVENVLAGHGKSGKSGVVVCVSEPQSEPTMDPQRPRLSCPDLNAFSGVGEMGPLGYVLPCELGLKVIGRCRAVYIVEAHRQRRRRTVEPGRIVVSSLDVHDVAG